MNVNYRNTFWDRLAFAFYHMPRNPFVLLLSVGFILYFTFAAVVPAARSSPESALSLVSVVVFIVVETVLILGVAAFWVIIVTGRIKTSHLWALQNQPL